MRRFMKVKGLRRGEKGFTLIELLIVVAILGILAAVIVPNLAAFLKTGKVAAANTEVANVESAALAYYADSNPNDWPPDADTLTTDLYLNKNPVQNYTFDSWGKVIPEDAADWDGSGAAKWDDANHKWIKA
jgi:type IV pilus assembly protein PilA